MHRIEPQQMRVGFHRPQIVDRDHLNIGATGFDDRAQDIAADPSESVDGNFDGHGGLFSLVRPLGALIALTTPNRRKLQPGMAGSGRIQRQNSNHVSMLRTFSPKTAGFRRR